MGPRSFLLILAAANLALSSFIGVFSTDKMGKKEEIRAFSHAQNYSWVAGQLYYNPIEGGFWGIRYGDLEDQYGGHFVLGATPSGFEEGDVVLLRGRVAEDQVSIFMSGALYEVESMQALDQPR